MKKTHILLLLMAAYTTMVHSQQEVNIFFRMLPNTVYSRTMDQTNEAEVKYSGPALAMARIKESGVSNPVKTVQRSSMVMMIHTGKPDADTTFPIIMEVKKNENSAGTRSIPEGTRLIGSCSVSGVPHFESVSSTQLSDSAKTNLIVTMESLLSQIKFAERRVKVGDKFTIETPISLPVSSFTLNMKIVTEYKLVKLKNGIAHFKLSQTTSMNSDISSYSIKATGIGKGYADMDVANGYYLIYAVNSTMSMSMKIESLLLNVTVKNESVQKSSILKE